MKKILITTGGTGGHVIPAEIICEHLKDIYEIYFSTDKIGLKYFTPNKNKIKIIEKIAQGKLNKFIADNTLLNQEWIMEPKKKVKDVINEVAGKDNITIKQFIRFKVGEGI